MEEEPILVSLDHPGGRRFNLADLDDLGEFVREARRREPNNIGLVLAHALLLQIEELSGTEQPAAKAADEQLGAPKRDERKTIA